MGIWSEELARGKVWAQAGRNWVPGASLTEASSEAQLATLGDRSPIRAWATIELGPAWEAALSAGTGPGPKGLCSKNQIQIKHRSNSKCSSSNLAAGWMLRSPVAFWKPPILGTHEILWNPWACISSRAMQPNVQQSFASNSGKTRQWKQTFSLNTNNWKIWSFYSLGLQILPEKGSRGFSEGKFK